MRKVCLIIGAGAGIGGSVGAKFAAHGYHAALCRRSDADGLQTLVEGIESRGGSASGHLLNAVEDGAIEKLVETVEQIGPSKWCCSTSVLRSVIAHSNKRH